MNDLKWLGVLCIVLSIYSCSKDDNHPVKDLNSMVLISQADSRDGNFHVELLAEDTLFAGYNKLYLMLTENSNGQKVSEASLKLFPLMNMVNKQHAAPVENPVGTTDADGYFEGAVVFIMPDNPDEHWSLGISIAANGNGDSVSLAIPVVRNLDEPRIVNAISPVDGKTCFIALLEPSKPIVGMNDFELAAYYRQDMMNFPAAGNLTVGFEPEMPSMGHSSPNNVSPVYMGNGHYKGKVNFTMTGWWRIHLNVEQNGQLLSDTLSFNITF